MSDFICRCATYSTSALGSLIDVRGVFSRKATSKGSIAETLACATRYERRRSVVLLASAGSVLCSWLTVVLALKLL